MAKTAIGTAMIEVLKENECDAVMWGDAHLLDWAFRRSGSKAKIRHPLVRWQIVLDALDRDERFEKWAITIDLYIRNGYRNRTVRCFKLIER